MSEVPARCAPFEEDLSALLDGQLEAQRANDVRTHVASCTDCTRRADALRGVDVALRSIAATPVSAAQAARLRPILAAERPAHRAPSRRRRWITPAALVATAAAAAAVVLVMRPVAPVAPEFEIAVVEQVAPKTRADAEAAAREMAAKIDTPMGASAPPSDPATHNEALSDAAGGVAAPDLLDAASDPDLVLATQLSELPALGSLRDLEVVEQLDLIEALGALDDAGAGEAR
jgi:anti-sigma factor RsiW